MTTLEAIILGIFQGISEFLPISSSGHLVLLQNIFGITEGNVFFTVMLHFGTLLAVLIVYFKDIANIIKECIKLVVDLITTRRLKLDNQYKILGVMIIIGSIPTAIMGILLEDFFEGLYTSIIAVGVALLITGVLLWLAEKKSHNTKKVKDLKVTDALIIGIFQGFAIAPGISRSGSTIVGALFRGLDKRLATKFSFLLSIPAILGASILEFAKVLSVPNNIHISKSLILGISLSCISGILAIKLLIKLLEKGKLHYFSYYVWLLGIVTIIIGVL